MDSYFSTKDEIWFLRVCHHISTGLYFDFVLDNKMPIFIGQCLFQVADRKALIFWDVTMCRTEDLNLQQHYSENLTTLAAIETSGTRLDIFSSVTELQETTLI
jgi:hypothetical protein